MRNPLYFLLLALAAALPLGFARIASASDEMCNVRMTVELTPDIPDARNASFLSSLLANHPEYSLSLLRQDDPSRIEVDLFGPGPAYLCRDVINTMRKDSRVLAIHVRSAAVWGSPRSGDPTAPDVRLSSAGIT